MTGGDEDRTSPAVEGMVQAERLIRQHAAHLAEHPRCVRVHVDRYTPLRPETQPSIHLTALFSDLLQEVEGVDLHRLAQLVCAETGLEIDPEYTGVFRWTRHGVHVYWWDWRPGTSPNS